MKFKNEIKVYTKLSFSSKTGFFGPGVCHLLELIDECGSIQQACESMEISYSKARKMINKLEKECDFPVVNRKAGGISGGSTTLTDEGRELVFKYNEMKDLLQKRADELYIEYFGEC